MTTHGLPTRGFGLFLQHLHPRPIGFDVRFQTSSRVARGVVTLRLPLVRGKVVHAEANVPQMPAPQLPQRNDVVHEDGLQDSAIGTTSQDRPNGVRTDTPQRTDDARGGGVRGRRPSLAGTGAQQQRVEQ